MMGVPMRKMCSHEEEDVIILEEEDVRVLELPSLQTLQRGRQDL